MLECLTGEPSSSTSLGSSSPLVVFFSCFRRCLGFEVRPLRSVPSSSAESLRVAFFRLDPLFAGVRVRGVSVIHA